MKTIGKCLKNNHSIQTLLIERNELGRQLGTNLNINDSCLSFAEGLKFNSTLKHLNIIGNSFRIESNFKNVIFC